MKKNILWLALIVMLVLAGCGLTDEEQMMARIYATQYAIDPVNNIPPPHYQTLAAQHGYVINVLPPTPTPAPPAGPPTMSAWEVGMTQIVIQQNGAATQQANQLQLERERMAADAKAAQQATAAYFAEETAVAYRIESTAQERERSMIATANAQGTQMMWTAQAAATATQGQKNIDDNNTAVAGIATSAVLPTHQLWTQEAIYAVQTMDAGEAESVRLAVRRQQLKNGLDAYLPWGILLALAYVGGVGFMKFVQTRAHGRDAHGAVPLLEVATNDGRVFVDAPAMESGLVKVLKTGEVIRYAPMDPNEQANINRRKQAIEAIRALPSELASVGKQMVSVEFGRAGGGRVLVGQNAAGPMNAVIDEANRKFMEEDSDG